MLGEAVAGLLGEFESTGATGAVVPQGAGEHEAGLGEFGRQSLARLPNRYGTLGIFTSSGDIMLV